MSRATCQNAFKDGKDPHLVKEDGKDERDREEEGSCINWL